MDTQQPTVVRATLVAETDQNGVKEAEYTVETFRLTVGLEYVMFCKDHVKIVYESKNQFLGVWESKNGPQQFWYTSDGYIIDNDRVQQDPFDIKRLHREPDMIYLLRKNDSYTSNNCFTSLDSAQTAAAERGGRVVPFKEVIEE